ncbi:hypothetical protein ACIQVO_17290 [Streptomyces sp. NPDC101062]|uniref:hypothetical protein n=1 Tax=unclassified Streptomyces TaxID=2593676 RepID=UPI002E7A7B2B|nr:hypothetical protein [Streptomyces sp. JV176]MEE1802786.1 hypothetical protein [Streptomyces sp. JV176]
MEDMHDLLQERARASQARLLELHGGIAPDAWESLLDRVENELAREGEKKEGAKRDEGSDGDEGDLRSVTEQTMGGSARHVTVGTLVAAAVGLLRHGAVCRPALP